MTACLQLPLVAYLTRAHIARRAPLHNARISIARSARTARAA